jgi:hypothetical protein
MALLRTLAAAALCAALVAPAAAGAAERKPPRHKETAHKKAPAPTPLATAAKVAAQYWGATPCAGSIKFITRQPRAAGLESNSSAWVTFGSPLGANNLAAPAESYTDCTIAFARWRWPTAASMRQDWAMFCTTMVHEWGHLLGKQHDTTPGSVMLPVFTDYSSVPPLCSASAPRRR